MNHDEPSARPGDSHAAPFDADVSTAAPLSAAGLARREAMLGDLIGSMRRVHARRRARRVAAAGIAVIGCVGIGVFALRPSPPATSNGPVPRVVEAHHAVPAPAPLPAANHPEHPAPSLPVVEYAVVRTDDSAVDRLRARGSGLVERIGDDALLATLTDLGRPAGLIRTDVGVRLTDPIIDPPS
jgi:hypothetical protein